MDNVKAVHWGRLHESDAIKELEEHLGKSVERSGLWLSTSGVLGCSPDGFVDEFCVEVKCRYKSRESSLSEDLSTDNTYIVFNNKSAGEWIVNKNHEYYHQIQGQIYLTNKSACHLVVWTPRETELFIIPKDDNWASNLTLLEKFYFEKLIPYVTDELINLN